MRMGCDSYSTPILLICFIAPQSRLPTGSQSQQRDVNRRFCLPCVVERMVPVRTIHEIRSSLQGTMILLRLALLFQATSFAWAFQPLFLRRTTVVGTTTTLHAAKETASSTPVHLLAGFLGAGKTSTLKELLENTEDLKLGIIVNDVASINIDAKLVKNSQSDIIQLENGCACCSLNNELLESVQNLIQTDDFDGIVVELSGVADPVAIQNTWDASVAKLSSIVTVVDASTFGSDYLTWDTARDRWNEEDCAGNRKISELLAEQVEAASVIILNKLDLADEPQLQVASGMVSQLNKDAKVLSTSWGKVPVRDILPEDTLGAVDCSEPDCADSSHSHNHDHNHDASACSDPDCTDSTHAHNHNHDASACSDPDCTDDSHAHNHNHVQTDDLGISSFVYNNTRPFSADRLSAILFQWPIPILEDLGKIATNHIAQPDEMSPFVGALRSKGFCWIAPTSWDGVLEDTWRHDTAMYWSHAGKHMGIQTAGKWWDTVDESIGRDFFKDSPGEYDRILREDFKTKEFGDRRQEVVFIGVNLQKEEIIKALDDCVLTDEEMEEYRSNLKKMQAATRTVEAY